MGAAIGPLKWEGLYAPTGLSSVACRDVKPLPPSIRLPAPDAPDKFGNDLKPVIGLVGPLNEHRLGTALAPPARRMGPLYLAPRRSAVDWADACRGGEAPGGP